MKYNSSDSLKKVEGIVKSCAVESRQKRLKVLPSENPCKPGCNHCCSRVIEPSLAELYIIREHLIKHKKWHEVKERCNELKKYDDIDKITWYIMKIKCPILDPKTGMCAAYDVRPLVCSTHYVSTNPESCDPWSMSKLEYARIDMTDLLIKYHKLIAKNYGENYWAVGFPVHKGLLAVDKLLEVSGISLEQVLQLIARGA